MISRAHAALLPSDALIETRRDVYRFAATPWQLSDRLLDSPLIRNALRAVMVDGRPLYGAEVQRAESMIHRSEFLACGSRQLSVVAAADSDQELGDVLSALGTDSTSFRTAVEPDFAVNLHALAEGADFAARVSSHLVEDLVPHVGLVGFLRPVDGRLAVHSASPRQFPGMILLGDPRTPIEAAEMLFHEAAHARYYDTIIVHDVLPPNADEFERFSPSWRIPGTHWPLEQVMAALHAYAVLAEFELVRAVHGRRDEVGPASLLPYAATRMREIGRWVLDRLDRLGSEAPAFVCGLLDLDPPAPVTPLSPPSLPAAVSVASGVEVRFGTCTDTAVVGRAGSPGDLYLLPSESGHVLQGLLEDNTVESAVARFADRHSLTAPEAEEAVRRILSVLAGQALIAVRGR